MSSATMTPREKLAAAIDTARADSNAASVRLRDAERRFNFAGVAIEDLKRRTKANAANAHAGLDKLAATADARVSAALNGYVAMLLHPDLVGPDAGIAAAWLLRDKGFVKAAHAAIDRAAGDESYMSMNDENPADLEAAMATAKAERADAEAAVANARAAHIAAARRLTDLELGKVAA